MFAGASITLSADQVKRLIAEGINRRLAAGEKPIRVLGYTTNGANSKIEFDLVEELPDDAS
jgi:hypothetical protein